MFDVLGIAPTQDTKAIRRAYATALKQLDQQVQREAFERLRSAYEQAMKWAERHAAAPEPTNQQAVPANTETTSSTAELADFNQIEAQREAALHQAAADELRHAITQRHAVIHRWVAELMEASDEQLPQRWRAALEDPELQHLEASAVFSSAIMAALAVRPEGKIALFEAASQRFDWRRIAPSEHYTPELTWLQQVMAEAGAVDRLGDEHRRGCKRIIGKMRSIAQPDKKELRKVRTDVLLYLFSKPAWLTLHVSRGTQENWRQALMTLTPAKRNSGSGRKNIFGWWGTFVFISAILKLLSALLPTAANTGKTAPPPPLMIGQPTPSTSYSLPGAYKIRIALPRVVSSAQSGTTELSHQFMIPLLPKNPNGPLRKILLNIPDPGYPAQARAQGRQGEVQIEMLIDWSKEIKAWVRRSSGSPDLDRAALNAIQSATISGNEKLSEVVLATMPFTFKLGRTDEP